MSRHRDFIRRIALVMGMLALAACSNIDRKHGYVPPDEDLELIAVGVDTKDTVADVVGRPTASGILADSGWYYVASKFRAYGIRERQEIDRQVVAISFADDGTVSNVERFGLENGNVIALSRRVTDSNIQGVSFLRQLFGSIGNFSADQLFGRWVMRDADYDTDNIFAKILRGEIPSFKIYEDDETYAFMDIMPRADGHSLVIPKTPCRNMLDASGAQLTACLLTVQKLSHAAMRAFDATGVTIQQFNEADGGQEVFHLHYHILPRHAGVSLRPPGQMADMDVLKTHAERIVAAL